MNEGAAAPAGQSEEGKAKWSTGQIVAMCLGGCLVMSFLAVLFLGGIGVLAAIAVPNFKEARGRAQLRACFANQKMLAGAVEMYQLDESTEVQRLDSALLGTLQEQGYLMEVPRDPGQGRDGDSSLHYLLVRDEDGFTIHCVKHGCLQGSGNPRRDLEAAGVTDPGVLGMAATEVPGRPR